MSVYLPIYRIETLSKDICNNGLLLNDMSSLTNRWSCKKTTIRETILIVVSSLLFRSSSSKFERPPTSRVGKDMQQNSTPLFFSFYCYFVLFAVLGRNILVTSWGDTCKLLYASNNHLVHIPARALRACALTYRTWDALSRWTLLSLLYHR